MFLPIEEVACDLSESVVLAVRELTPIELPRNIAGFRGRLLLEVAELLVVALFADDAIDVVESSLLNTVSRNSDFNMLLMPRSTLDAINPVTENTILNGEHIDLCPVHAHRGQLQ